MPIQILVHGRPLSPDEAVRRMLPLDTLMRCPACNSGAVQAYPPKYAMRLDGERDDTIPRQQDRQCLECCHTWMTVLPPESVTTPHTPLYTGWSR